LRERERDRVRERESLFSVVTENTSFFPVVFREGEREGEREKERTRESVFSVTTENPSLFSVVCHCVILVWYLIADYI
jgi:hypothetical protein